VVPDQQQRPGRPMANPLAPIKAHADISAAQNYLAVCPWL
jgi:hypothetical protein